MAAECSRRRRNQIWDSFNASITPSESASRNLYTAREREAQRDFEKYSQGEQKIKALYRCLNQQRQAPRVYEDDERIENPRPAVIRHSISIVEAWFERNDAAIAGEDSDGESIVSVTGGEFTQRPKSDVAPWTGNSRKRVHKSHNSDGNKVSNFGDTLDSSQYIPRSLKSFKTADSQLSVRKRLETFPSNLKLLSRRISTASNHSKGRLPARVVDNFCECLYDKLQDDNMQNKKKHGFFCEIRSKFQGTKKEKRDKKNQVDNTYKLRTSRHDSDEKFETSVGRSGGNRSNSSNDSHYKKSQDSRRRSPINWGSFVDLNLPDTAQKPGISVSRHSDFPSSNSTSRPSTPEPIRGTVRENITETHTGQQLGVFFSGQSAEAGKLMPYTPVAAQSQFEKNRARRLAERNAVASATGSSKPSSTFKHADTPAAEIPSVVKDRRARRAANRSKMYQQEEIEKFWGSKK